MLESVLSSPAFAEVGALVKQRLDRPLEPFDVWNRFYAEVFGVKDSVILGIYSLMIDSFLYLPDYPLGHLIAFQIERHVETAGAVGPEIERMARQGRLTPDLWMRGAVGAAVGPEALLAATKEALAEVRTMKTVER